MHVQLNASGFHLACLLQDQRTALHCAVHAAHESISPTCDEKELLVYTDRMVECLVELRADVAATDKACY